MGVRTVLAILLLFLATATADERVYFFREYFTMMCPENGDWYRAEGDKLHNDTTYKLKYSGETKGLYYCEYLSEEEGERKRYYFYVKGKACENCFELEPNLMGLFIGADVLGTVFLMMIIFKCTKKKSSAGPKAPARSGGRGPPVPSPDYEQLKTHTRSQDTYSVMNRTG